MGDFGLVRGIGGVPAWIFQHVAQNDLGGLRFGITQADHGFLDYILAGNGFQPGEGFGFRAGLGKLEWCAADGGGNRLLDQSVECRGAQLREHIGDVGAGRAEVAGNEFVTLLKHSKRLGEWQGRGL